MIWPWPPTPILRLAFSAGPLFPAGAAVAAGAPVPAPLHATVRRSARPGKIDLVTCDKCLRIADSPISVRASSRQDIAHRLRLPAHQPMLELSNQHFDNNHDHTQDEHAGPYAGRIEIALGLGDDVAETPRGAQIFADHRTDHREANRDRKS